MTGNALLSINRSKWDELDLPKLLSRAKTRFRSKMAKWVNLQELQPLILRVDDNEAQTTMILKL
jgi:hypothetical protein